MKLKKQETIAATNRERHGRSENKRGAVGERAAQQLFCREPGCGSDTINHSYVPTREQFSVMHIIASVGLEISHSALFLHNGHKLETVTANFFLFLFFNMWVYNVNC